MAQWTSFTVGLLSLAVVLITAGIRFASNLATRMSELKTTVADLRGDLDKENRRGDEMLPKIVRIETLLDLLYKKLEVKERT